MDSKKSFEYWQMRLGQMPAASLDNFFAMTYEEQKEWSADINFLSAVADRFLELASFGKELDDEGRKGCIARSQKIAEMIRHVFADKVDMVRKFDEAYAHAADYYRIFGYGTVLHDMIEADPTDQVVVLQKAEAALVQIHAAIRCYETQDWPSAVTLAGAAEGCLPDVADAKTIYSVAKEIATKRGPAYAEAFKKLNEIRDWLKHSGENHRKFMEVEKRDAAIMVSRAIIKYYSVTRSQTDVMDMFEQSFRTSFPQFISP